jgi:hypothetical protein
VGALARCVKRARPVRARSPARALLGVPSLLAGSGSTTDGQAFDTASIAPAAGRLVLAAIISHQAAGTVDIPTLAGNGLTWVQVLTVTQGQRRLTVFHAMGAAPSVGAVTVSFPTTAQTAVCWDIVEIPQADRSGANGAGAIGRTDTTSTGAAVTVQADFGGALESPQNLAVAFVGVAVASGVVPDVDFTEVPSSDVSALTTTVGLACHYAYGQTICDPTFASSAAVIAMVEVKAA